MFLSFRGTIVTRNLILTNNKFFISIFLANKISLLKEGANMVRILKKCLFLLALIFISSGLLAGVSDIIENAKKNNLSFQNALIAFEQAKMDHDKALKEAQTIKEELMAKRSYLSVYQSYLESLYSHVSTVFNEYIEYQKNVISYNLAKDKLELSQSDLTRKQELEKKGLVSKTDVIDAELIVKEDQVSLEQAKYNLEKSKEDLLDLLGTQEIPNWDLEAASTEVELPTLDVLTSKSVDIQLSEISLQLAKYDLDSMSSDTSLYDQKTYKNNYVKAQNSLEDTKNRISDSYSDDLFTIKILQSQIEIQKERVQNLKADLSTAEQKFKKGLISETEYYNAENNYYSALSVLYDRVGSFIKSVVRLYILAEDDYTKALDAVFKEQGLSKR